MTSKLRSYGFFLFALAVGSAGLKAGWSTSSCDDSTYPYYTHSGSGSFATNSSGFASAIAQLNEYSGQNLMTCYAASYDTYNYQYLLAYGSGYGSIYAGYDLSYDSADCVRAEACADADASTYVHCSVN
jgi:hypothetical protein